MHTSMQTQSESHVGSKAREGKQQRANVHGWQIKREWDNAWNQRWQIDPSSSQLPNFNLQMSFCVLNGSWSCC